MDPNIVELTFKQKIKLILTVLKEEIPWYDVIMFTIFGIAGAFIVSLFPCMSNNIADFAFRQVIGTIFFGCLTLGIVALTLEFHTKNVEPFIRRIKNSYITLASMKKKEIAKAAAEETEKHLLR